MANQRILFRHYIIIWETIQNNEEKNVLLSEQNWKPPAPRCRKLITTIGLIDPTWYNATHAKTECAKLRCFPAFLVHGNNEIHWHRHWHWQKHTHARALSRVTCSSVYMLVSLQRWMTSRSGTTADCSPNRLCSVFTLRVQLNTDGLQILEWNGIWRAQWWCCCFCC